MDERSNFGPRGPRADSSRLSKLHRVHNCDLYRPDDDSGRVGLAFSALASSGGRAGLKRFDKSRIDAGTPHGLPRVTVNGISAPRATRGMGYLYLVFNYDFDFDFIVSRLLASLAQILFRERAIAFVLSAPPRDS